MTSFPTHTVNIFMDSNVIDKLALITLRDRKIAMVRSHNKTLFYIPGGKREPNETDEQALCRELDEELTLTLHPDSIRFYGEFIGSADGKQDGIQVRIRCYFADYDDTPVPAAEIAELAWFDSHDLPLCSATAAIIVSQLQQDDLIN